MSESDGAAASGSGDPPARALGAVVQRRLVAFDPMTGAPTVTNVPMMTPAQIGNLAAAALSAPYEDPLGLEPQYAGLTCGEVAMAKRAQRAAASGGIVETESLLDRAIGKPKNSSENVNVNVNGSYEDFLREKAAKISPAVADVVEAEVVDPLFG